MVKDELNCFFYCMKIAINKVRQGDLEQAEFYIKNAERSLKVVKKSKGAAQ